MNFRVFSNSNKYYFLSTLIILLISCNDNDCVFNCDFDFESDEFSNCIPDVCNEQIGEYCLFGLKWGDETKFNNIGHNVKGPQSAGGLVSYSYQKNATLINNHKQINVPPLSFSLMPNCAESNIERAFDEWASISDIEFNKMQDDSNSDIKIYVANIYRAGLAYPNFDSNSCNEIGGQIIFNPNDIQFPDNCDQFYLLALHEIGHSLGLGHSSDENVMGFLSENFRGLQPGDIKGVQEIYGEN